MSNKKSPQSRIRVGLAEFGKKHPLKEPDLKTKEYDDELRALNWKNGVRQFPPKTKHIENHTKSAPTSAQEMATNPPFLWVALKDRIKIILETASASKKLCLKKIKHTNITGGRRAFSGGEVWFIAPQTVVVNGSSGRYGPRSKKELDDIVNIFIKSGWQIKSVGWDEDQRRPAKFPR